MRFSAAMRARLTKDFTFEAAQTLPAAPAGHKCRKMHGHSFKVEVTVEGEVDRVSGWVYDHAEIGAAMKPLVGNPLGGAIVVVSLLVSDSGLVAPVALSKVIHAAR